MRSRGQKWQLRGLYLEDGVEVSYTVFLSYMSRIRRERFLSPFVKNRQPPTVPAPAKAPAEREDPLASAMRALSKPRYDIREAMCDGDPTKKVVLTVRFPPLPFLTR
jgi:hypothetical protein